MTKHEFSDKERKLGNASQRKAAIKRAERSSEITQRDCELIDEGWHRFWMNRGGSPKVRDDLVFGKRAKPRGH